MASPATQTANAIAAINNRSNLVIPEIDFTQHQLENGEIVSTTERVIKDVQAPAMYVPTDDQFWSKVDKTKPDIAFLKNHFYREGRLTEEQALYILEKGGELLRSEPNLLEVDAPITGKLRVDSCISLMGYSVR